MANDAIEVLLVEDDAGEAELTRMALRASGWAPVIHLARDGEEALDFLFCRGPHIGRNRGAALLVVLDLKLPKVGGLEVLSAMREDPRTALTPVVVFSSSAAPADIDESYRRGVNSYIQKPYDFDESLRAIRRIGEYWLGLNRAP